MNLLDKDIKGKKYKMITTTTHVGFEILISIMKDF